MMIYEFKVTLKEVGAPVWRVIQMDSSATFKDLHQVLQVAFDWDNYHLHSFFVHKTNGKHVENMEIKPEYEGESNDSSSTFDVHNENEQIVSDWFKVTKDSMTYLYDFGDDWAHEIVFTKKLKPEKGVGYPRCVASKNVAPEEDTRGEVIMGDVDLTHQDSNHLVEDINQELRFQLPDLFSNVVKGNNDDWEDVLVKAKAFHKLKPWELMNDEQIFAVIDPVTEEKVFCSVLGSGDETFGMVVYVGEVGYKNLVDTLRGEKTDLEIAVSQHSLLLSFEDREDLGKQDYALIKTYDIPFRGRKAWPQFFSNKPGFYPWMMDEEEARLMLVALNQVMDVYKQRKDGLEMPHILDGQVLVRVPQKDKDKVVFENQIMDLPDDPEETQQVPLAISELDLQRMKKPKGTIKTTIEFSMEYMMMPIQEDPNERPVLPLLIVAADHNKGLIIYQNLLQDAEVGVLQSELLKMTQTINGIPEKVLMDKKTAHIMAPLIDKMMMNVDVVVDLPVIRDVMEGFHQNMLP